MKLYNSKDIKVGSTGGAIALKGRQVLWRKGKSIEIFDQVGIYNWTCPLGVWEIDILIVAGGGAGGGRPDSSGSWHAGGGGGAGGVIYRTIPVVPGITYEIVVGEGGEPTPRGSSPNSDTALRNGEDSKFFTITAKGGGGGGDSDGGSGCLDGLDGGSGGGAASCGTERSGGSGIADQGHDGASGQSNDGHQGNKLGGSGGSANGWNDAGHVGGSGGDGPDFSDEFGDAVGINGRLAGGGGAGSSNQTNTRAPGGEGGGGKGGTGEDEDRMDGLDAAPGTGSGGGGGGRSHAIGGKGAGGVVALKYQPESNRDGPRRFKKDHNSNERSLEGDTVGWAVDLSPYMQHASQTGSRKPQLIRQDGRWAVDFTRDSDHCLHIDSSTGTHLDQLSEFTIEAWVYIRDFNAGSYMYVLNRNNDDGTSDWAYCLGKDNDDRYFLNVNGSMVLSYSGDLPVNEWAHLAAVYNASNNRLYLNGEVVDTSSSDQGTTDSKPNLQISGRAGSSDQSTSNYEFDGIIKEVRIWGKARSKEQILKLKDARLWGDESDLLGYWPL